MKPKSFMLIAGEASGDALAAELVAALREKVLETESGPTADAQPLRTQLEPVFFGAGGPQMAAAGVELAFDLTQHSVIGISGAASNGLALLRRLLDLRKLAIERQPDAIVLVDFSFFNHSFAKILKRHVARHLSEFSNWSPRIVKYVSPQVWASRPGRADRMPRDFDLLLSIFPFEKDWYARRVPRLRVEFVGHPMIGRFASVGTRSTASHKSSDSGKDGDAVERVPTILLLPGSRKSELRRHLPVMFGAMKLIRGKLPDARAKVVFPDADLKNLAEKFFTLPPDWEVQIGNLSPALAEADVAISKTGTVTMECAFFGLPTVTFYMASWINWEIAKRIVTVKSATMPNLLAGAEVYPEFLQDTATPENISRAALDLLQNETRRAQIQKQLADIVSSLGGPGASDRAAEAVLSLLP